MAGKTQKPFPPHTSAHVTKVHLCMLAYSFIYKTSSGDRSNQAGSGMMPLKPETTQRPAEQPALESGP